jgi:hypothetical protein
MLDTFKWVCNTPLSPVFFPLSISLKSFYQSEFNKNYADYGYVLRDEETGYWTNDYFNIDTATALAEKFNKDLMYTNTTPASWFLMTLLSHGISLEDAVSLQTAELPWAKILRQRHIKIAEYKKRLLLSQIDKYKLNKEIFYV